MSKLPPTFPSLTCLGKMVKDDATADERFLMAKKWRAVHFGKVKREWEYTQNI